MARPVTPTASRRATIAALVAVKERRAGVLTARDVQKESHALYAALLRHFGSLAAARTVLRARRPPAPNQKWSQAQVLSELKRVARHKIRLVHRELQEAGYRGLCNAAMTYCGGLPRARRLAGVAEPRIRRARRSEWDEDRVLSDILDRHGLGQPLALSKAPTDLVGAAVYRFGSWEAAIEAAGLDYSKIRLLRAPYSREELLALLVELATRRPNMTLGALHHHRAAPAILREFGSFERGARAADLTGWPRRLLGPPFTRPATLRAIRSRRGAGRSIRASVVEREDAKLFLSAGRHFGTWLAAVAAAGIHIARNRRLARSTDFVPGRRPKWTLEEVRNALSERQRAGLPMNPAALRHADAGLYQAAKKLLRYSAELARRVYHAPKLTTRWTRTMVISELRASPKGGRALRPALKLAATKLFGSMVAAREASGLPPLRREWTDEDILRTVRVRARNKRDGTLISIAQRRFGSWRAALEAAGVEPLTRSRWTQTEIRAALKSRHARGFSLAASAVLRDAPSLYYAVHNRYGAFAPAVSRLVSGSLGSRGAPSTPRRSRRS